MAIIQEIAQYMWGYEDTIIEAMKVKDIAMYSVAEVINLRSERTS